MVAVDHVAGGDGEGAFGGAGGKGLKIEDRGLDVFLSVDAFKCSLRERPVLYFSLDPLGQRRFRHIHCPGASLIHCSNF